MTGSLTRWGGALLVLGALLGTLALAAEPAQRESKEFKRATSSQLEFQLPEVSLVRDDGKTVTLPAELNDGRPVVLTFIFTKCGTICPVMSQTFAQLQSRFADQHTEVHLVSISIDPEYDTPERLADYARGFHAGPRWHFYTGSVEATISAQRAFATYRGDKMSHSPVTFLRGGRGDRWERIDGFATPDELAGALHKLVAAQ